MYYQVFKLSPLTIRAILTVSDHRMEIRVLLLTYVEKFLSVVLFIISSVLLFTVVSILFNNPPVITPSSTPSPPKPWLSGVVVTFNFGGQLSLPLSPPLGTLLYSRFQNT